MDHRLEWRAAPRPGKLARAWCKGCTWAMFGRSLTEVAARENHALHLERVEEVKRGA